MSSAATDEDRTVNSPRVSQPIALPPVIFQMVAQHAPVGLYILQEGHLRYANRWFSDILGHCDPTKLIGSYFWDLVHPDDRCLVQLKSKSTKTAQARLDRPFFRLRRKDGTYVLVTMNGTNTIYKGKPANCGYVLDATRIQGKIDDLQASLRRHESILDDVDVQLGEMDLDGNVTYINDAGCRIWGLPREEIMGLNYRTYMDKETADRLFALYREIFYTGKPIKNAVFNVKDKDGKQRTIEKSVSTIRDANGTVTGFRMVTKDITERMMAETRLNEQRSHLEAIFSSVKDAIIMVNPDLKVIEANKSTKSICGICPEELTGKSFSHCRTKCGQACLEVLKRTVDKKSAIKDYLIECDRENSPHQVVNLSTSPLMDPKKRFIGAVMVVRDMTLLRDLKGDMRNQRRLGGIIGQSKVMQDIFRLIEDLAKLETTVLVTGESGTGKELVAKALHFNGNRSRKPFITVNCAALSENLLESELFGHVKGAFTGAVNDKQGRFQAADSGTILLDEIGEISPAMQVKLLRVLQEKEFERVGETAPQKVDVRVIACTNQDLKVNVASGEFRQDLYYRLKVVEIEMPPLRKRHEDLPLLVDHFLHKFNKRFDKKIEGISRDVIKIFNSYSWPGNVRELEHVIEHAFVLCRGSAITVDHLPADIKQGNDDTTDAKFMGRAQNSPNAKQILDALNQTDWNKAKAARLLGIGRRTIYRKIETFQLSNDQT